MQARNWFSQGGQAYAAFRPQYPAAVAAHLASQVRARRLAVDVGCGSGQLTRLLAPHFAAVIGLDPSADQLASAVPVEGVSYHCAPAEDLPLADASADLITAAQSAHWFDLTRFYNEVRRVSRKGGVLALISYGVLRLEPELNARLEQFYWNEIGAFWPPERRLVESGYSTLDFPFVECAPPAMEIRLNWDLSEFLGYLSTWSAVRNARDMRRDDVLLSFVADMTALWCEPSTKRSISWPINMRLGRL
ncbi:MAG: class I SAM-dependent methyltransferase [Opitutaceae bacterium]|nr:class I SAM-dependent methyltransferase [Opitutaceae bacterium]